MRSFYLDAGKTYVVGSAGDADVSLPVNGVSRRHASLEVLPDGGVGPRAAKLRPLFELALEMLASNEIEPAPEPAVADDAEMPAPASFDPAMRRLYRRAAKRQRRYSDLDLRRVRQRQRGAGDIHPPLVGS